VRQIADEVRAVTGAVDVHLGQEVNASALAVDVDRARAEQAGLTQRDVANSMLISLSSSGQIAPTQWLNPQNGVSYQVQVQTQQYRIDSLDARGRTPVTAAQVNVPAQLLGNLATMRRTASTALVSHYDVQPVFVCTPMPIGATSAVSRPTSTGSCSDTH
jgi:multidrug efflux pump subunit AcrB